MYLFQNQKAYDFETWHESSDNGAHINHHPGMTSTSLRQLQIRSPMHLNGKKIGKCHLMAENLLGMSKWTEDENMLGPGSCLPMPRGYIHVYDHNIQKSSSLKPHGQSKPNFMWSILRKRE